MTAADLLSWQRRLGLSQPGASKVLAIPLATYRGYIQGRRHAGELPGWLCLLCRYVERHGALN